MSSDKVAGNPENVEAPQETEQAEVCEEIKNMEHREYLEKYVCNAIQKYLADICNERPEDPVLRFSDMCLAYEVPVPSQ